MNDLANMSLQQLIALAGDQAKKVMTGTKEQLLPTFLLVAPGDVRILATPFEGPEQKAMLIEAVRVIAKEIGAVRYSFLCEAWTATQVDENDTRTASERPDRKEIVMAVASDGKRTVRGQWDILRLEDGTCVELKEDASARDSDIVYDRLNILGERETRH